MSDTETDRHMLEALICPQTHAVLTYAEALAFGALPPSRRQDREAIKADPVDVTQVLHEALEIGNDGAHLGLLEHDFRDPDTIRCDVLLPRQVRPSMFHKPVQHIDRDA